MALLSRRRVGGEFNRVRSQRSEISDFLRGKEALYWSFPYALKTGHGYTGEQALGKFDKHWDVQQALGPSKELNSTEANLRSILRSAGRPGSQVN